MMFNMNELFAFDADYSTKKELQIKETPNGFIARYVYFGTKLWDMYDDGIDIIRKIVDDKNSITNAEKEKYLNSSLESRLFYVDFDDESKYINAFIDSEFSRIAIYLREFLNNDIEISYCKHCKKPFISNGKSIYCHRFDNTVHRPCRTIGALNSYQQNLGDNPAMAEYRKAYKRYIARVNADKISKDDFKNWQISTKAIMADFEDNLISWEKYLKQVNIFG